MWTRFTALIISLSLLQGWAATYYVATNGSDSADGSLATPWLSIGHASSNIAAGDTVSVSAGTYSERPTFRTGGTEGSRIVFDGQPGATIGPVTGVVENVGLKISAPFITFRGFDFIGGTNVTVGEGHVFVTSLGSSFNFVSNRMWYDPDVNSGARMFYVKETGAWSLGSASNTLVAWNTFSNWNYIAVWMNGMNYTVASNLFTDSGPSTAQRKGDAIYFFGTGGTFRGNVFRNVNEVDPAHVDIFQTYGSVASGMGVVTTNILFDGNLVTNSDCQIFNFSSDLTYASNKVGDFTFRNNIFGRTGYQGNCYVESLKLYNNTFYQVATNGSGGANCVILNFAPPTTTLSNLTGTGASDTITVLGTVYASAAAEDATHWAYNADPKISATNIYHFFTNYPVAGVSNRMSSATNVQFVFRMTNPGIWTTNVSATAFAGIGNTGNGTSDNADLRNNLFIECGSDATVTNLGGYQITAGSTNIVTDYNMIAGANGWAKQPSLFSEANGINGGDVKFVSTNAFDFRLVTGSPALNAGVNLSALFTTDFTGATRSGWSMGAYEAGTNIATPTVLSVTGSVRTKNVQKK